MRSVDNVHLSEGSGASKKAKKYDFNEGSDVSHQENPENLKMEKRQKVQFKSGATYEGEWIGNSKDGYGVQEWPDGARYEGYWKSNRAHGKGKFYHTDGDYFEGEWIDDQANGYGTYQHANGNSYKGYWKSD